MDRYGQRGGKTEEILRRGEEYKRKEEEEDFKFQGKGFI